MVIPPPCEAAPASLRPAQGEAQAEYGRLWAPIASRYGARLIKGKAAPVLLEGRDTSRVLLVEFPSLDAARACYEDPEYAAAVVWAHKAATRDLVIFEGEVGGKD